ncbi:uncharacterized protein LOC134717599 [Mytilus trossulus]|uniref:uncharacterized protein LOC134717599 n=1 Tax=Mytilus trossulus TaxID=6551 RepID=UPI0030043688
MAAAKYRLWTVPKLKAELSIKGAVITGRKADLIDRLVAYDRNHNFKPPLIEIPEATDIEWPKHGYKQLIADHRLVFSKVTREQIDGYFLFRLAGDKQVNGDIKALEKGRDLLQAKKILACSVLILVDGIFLSGIVGAAMKKQVTYNYHIKLDKSGSPVNSKCECPAGKGPNATCKHVAAVLLMADVFSNTGEISIQKSCTEGLQTFQQPKTYYNGAPVKIEKLAKRKPTEILEDPRPQKYRNMEGFTDHVRNTMINFCSQSSQDLTLRYIFPAADIQTAQLDHAYLSLPFAEYWVDRALLVTEQQAKLAEKESRGQSSNKKWFYLRQWRITASRFGEISKITTRRNIQKLCESLCSQKFLKVKSVLHGKMYEQKAITQFEKKFQMKCQPCGLFISADKPFLGASPDALIGDDCVVEVKCPYTGRDESIVPGVNFSFLEYDKDNNITLKKSSNYYDQIQGQLFLSNREHCYFIVYTFKDLFVEKIGINHDYCVGCLLPKLELFYSKHFRPYIASIL